MEIMIIVANSNIIEASHALGRLDKLKEHYHCANCNVRLGEQHSVLCGELNEDYLGIARKAIDSAVGASLSVTDYDNIVRDAMKWRKYQLGCVEGNNKR